MAAWELFVDGKYGNDAWDGKTWATAKKTLQAAHDIANSGTTIRVGEMHPSVGQSLVVSKWNIAVVGNSMSRSPFSGCWINPVAPDASVIKVRAPNCTLENLMVQAGPDFTGIGVDAEGASGLILRNVTYQGTEDADANQLFGGIGFRFQNSERVAMSDCTAQNATLGLLIGREASCGHAINYAGIQNYQDLVADGGGGWHFSKTKCTNSGKPGEMTAVVHLKRGSGEFLFDAADWCEAGPNRVLIESDHNVFVRPVSSPACEWHILGHHNHFYGARTLGGDWYFDGNYNRVDGGEWLSAIKGTGKRNRFSDVVGRALDYHGDHPYYDNSSFATVASKGTNVVGSLYKP